jgi:hypothetical protein
MCPGVMVSHTNNPKMLKKQKIIYLATFIGDLHIQAHWFLVLAGPGGSRTLITGLLFQTE